MITLCCGRARCARVKQVKDGYEIEDDYGGKVKLTTEEMRKLVEFKWSELDE